MTKGNTVNTSRYEKKPPQRYTSALLFRAPTSHFLVAIYLCLPLNL